MTIESIRGLGNKLMAKVLLVEDDETLSAMIIDWLQNERFLVNAVANGNEGMSLLKVNQYDAIILDWNLPGMSGVDICRAYRGAGGRAPVIMLTAKAMISDKAQGFDSGADDYLTKPFDVRELAMRVHALLRRPATMPSNVLRAKNGLELDPQKHRVTKNGEEVHLLPRDFELLQLFMRYPDEVFSPEALLVRAWNSDADATMEGLRTAIKRIRKKIDDAEDESQSAIETIRRVGYRFRG